MKILWGIIIGLAIGWIIFSAGVSYATRTYAHTSREILISFDGDAISVLNKELRDIWASVDDIDKRLTAGSL